MGLGALTFAAPWLLLALAALPVLWWLLRLTPPAPRQLRFPAIRLLFGLEPREETPDRTPLWLILLRLLLAALLILALAHPILNADSRFPGGGPLLLVVDDGWAAAPDWSARARALEELIDQAEREGLPVLLQTTAPKPAGSEAAPGLQPAAEARRLARALAPQPWGTDRAAALAALARFELGGGATVIWLADGLAEEEEADFAAGLLRLGSLRVLRPEPADLALLLRPPLAEPGGLILRLARADATGERPAFVRAAGEDGRLLFREEVRFAAGRRTLEQRIELPVELYNRLGRLAIEGQDSAGATVLMDERWRHRPVGLVSGSPEGAGQPLLGDLYYLERALAPYSELRRGSIGELLQRELAVLVLADVGALTGEEESRLRAWVEGGGLLLRFAGERLAQNADSLLPVRLRGGGRTLGGALSWSEPAGLAAFPGDGPFAGLPVPGEVTVRRQVLAEPEPELGDKTWARLADGTPLVTGQPLGEGWLVLVHTTANSDWSNLPLSGLFVDMLRRIVGISAGVAAEESAGVLPPLETLDGFGRPGTPPATALPAPSEVVERGLAGPRHPPGYYGRETARRALNLSSGIAELAPMGPLPPGATEAGFDRSRELDLKPWLLAAAALLLLIDMAIALALRGLLPRRRPAAPIAAPMAALLLALLAAGAAAQEPPPDDPDAFAIAATADTRLAFVRTGVPEVDATSRAGLAGLSLILNQRTAVETPGPLGVDVERDELAFFPLLYWPVTDGQPPPSDAAVARLNDYLRNGGMILFDTRDQRATGTFDSPAAGSERLRALARGLDIPPLTPVPPDHVLTKTFYLMQEFPGRWAGGTVWVEREVGRVNDGVSPVIVGGADWAAAWAVDDGGRPMFAAVPGGERQREMAYRFGVNLVMYALTGNYKSDQVHVPAILERLGQ